MFEQLKELHIGKVVREWQFHPDRKWKLDFAILQTADHYVDLPVAIEIEGGAFVQGRHTRGKGFMNDMEKYNQAVLFGFKVLRFSPQQVLKGEAIALIREVLEA